MPTVLVVDDSKFSRGRVVAALEPLGYTLIEAEDGLQGLQAYELHAPDLIITDLLMPALDGFGFLRGLRERGAQEPVIVQGAEIQADRRALCIELGAVSFLNKPFQSGELAAQVRQALQTSIPVGTCWIPADSAEVFPASSR